MLKKQDEKVLHERAINVQPSDRRVRCFTLYTHSNWIKYSWESINDSQYMIWDIRRCYYGDPHPHPNKYEKVFYTDSELCHAQRHNDVVKVAFMLECRYITPDYYDYLEANIDVFDAVLTYDDLLLSKYPDKCTFYPHGNCVIKREDFDIYQKTRMVSFISSTKRMNVSGHNLRHAFYELYTTRANNWVRYPIGDTTVDLYGSLAHNFIDYKLESLKDHMFQIVVENSVLDTYFTEKILDCFVTGTVPIYYGTKKITDYFDPEGIIQFSTLEELFEILGALTEEMYHSRREAIARNFKLAQQYIIPEDWIFEHTDIFK